MSFRASESQLELVKLGCETEETTNFDDLVTLPGSGRVPVNVARICQWTWMCEPPPRGPNVHGRPVGDWVMAGAFLVTLTRAHGPSGNELTSRSARLLTSQGLLGFPWVGGGLRRRHLPLPQDHSRQGTPAAARRRLGL